MKNMFYWLFWTFIICLSSCSTDPCEDTICLNNGICDEGSCACPNGWTGADCSIYDFDYVGIYSTETYTNTGCNDALNNGTFSANDEGLFCSMSNTNKRTCRSFSLNLMSDGTWVFTTITIEETGGISLSNLDAFGGTYSTDEDLITLLVDGSSEEAIFQVSSDRSHLIWAIRPSATSGCQTTHMMYK